MKPKVDNATGDWPKGLSLRLTRILGSIGAGLLLCSPAAAKSVVSQVVLSTDPAPGAGVAFGGLSAPSLNAQGCIAFVGGPTSTLYSNAHGQVCGTLARAVGAGDVPPGVLG